MNPGRKTGTPSNPPFAQPVRVANPKPARRRTAGELPELAWRMAANVDADGPAEFTSRVFNRQTGASIVDARVGGRLNFLEAAEHDQQGVADAFEVPFELLDAFGEMGPHGVLPFAAFTRDWR